MSYGAPNLPADKHFFFDRHGGVSAGKYASLNGSIKSDDDRENVLKNFALAAAHYHLPLKVWLSFARERQTVPFLSVNPNVGSNLPTAW